VFEKKVWVPRSNGETIKVPSVSHFEIEKLFFLSSCSIFIQNIEMHIEMMCRSENEALQLKLFKNKQVHSFMHAGHPKWQN
jgi:hypothetical protein